MTSVTVLLPCWQERDFMRPCLESVLAFGVPRGVSIEVLVLDGMSTDGTRQIVEEIARRDARVRLIDNPGRIQSTAMNIGISLSKSDYVVRLDAHSTYPRDYLRQCLETSWRTGADNVGGLVITQARGSAYQATLVQALTTHKFGVGDSGYRTSAREGCADTVPYGCYRREIFSRVGLFDERLVRGQDYEMNRRIARAGGKVWLNPAIRVFYYQQPDLLGFYRKQIGKEAPYNAYMWYLAPYAFAARHAVTGVFAAGVLGGVWLSWIWSPIRPWFVGVMAVYTLLAVLAAARQAWRYRRPMHLFTLPACFFLYHFFHGLGVLYGLLRLAARAAPVQRTPEPWPDARRFRAWPPVETKTTRRVDAAVCL